MADNLTSRGARATTAARLPALPASTATDPTRRQWEEMVREWLEVRLGARGDFYERAVTHRELRDQLAQLNLNVELTPEQKRLLDLIGGFQQQFSMLSRQFSALQSYVNNIYDNSNSAITNIYNQVRDVAVEDMAVFARDMLPTATGGCSALTTVELSAGQPNYHVLLFDKTTQESADFHIMLPNAWVGRMFKVYVYWAHASGATAFDVVWEVTSISTSNNESLIQTFPGGAVITDTGGTAGNLYIAELSAAVPVERELNSNGDLLSLRVMRLPTHASDTLDIDAGLIAVRFTLTDIPFPQEPDPSASELYLRFEGDFADSSVAARTVTDHGAARSTAHPGGGSTEGMVGNGSYLSVVDDGFADIGTRLFQLRFHLYITTAATLATDNIIIGKWGATDGSWFVNIYGTSGALNWGRKNGSYFYNQITDAAIPRDTLVQVTIWRHTVNGQIFCALDGDVQTPTAGGTHDTTTNNLAIGAVIGGGAALPAGVYIDEVQFKIDETDYPTNADFTPPTPPYI